MDWKSVEFWRDFMTMLGLIIHAVEKGKAGLIEELVIGALERGVSANVILNEALITGLSVVGKKYDANEIFVPEMLLAAKTVEKGMRILKQSINHYNHAILGTLIVGTIKGDQHAIGKDALKFMAESVGFNVIDLGVNVPTDVFVDAISRNPNCKIVAISVFLTTLIDSLKSSIQKIKDSGCGSQVKIMVGGAALSSRVAKKVGADAYNKDLRNAVSMAILYATEHTIRPDENWEFSS